MLEERSITVLEAYFIMESLDSKHEITELTPPPLTPMQVILGVSDNKHYALDGGKAGYAMTFKRAGAYEIHHYLQPEDTKKVISGEMVGKTTNMRFVGTMAHLAKEFLDKGHSVRIAGRKDNGMFDHYKKVGTILAKRHNLIVSPVSEYKVPGSKNVSEFTISHHVGEGAIINFLMMRTNDATDENGYDIGEI